MLGHVAGVEYCPEQHEGSLDGLLETWQSLLQPTMAPEASFFWSLAGPAFTSGQ